jgi:hypothetical protein
MSSVTRSAGYGPQRRDVTVTAKMSLSLSRLRTQMQATSEEQRGLHAGTCQRKDVTAAVVQLQL